MIHMAAVMAFVGMAVLAEARDQVELFSWRHGRERFCWRERWR